MGLPHLINPNKHMHGHNVATFTNIERTFSVVVVESDRVLFGVEPRVQTGTLTQIRARGDMEGQSMNGFRMHNPQTRQTK